jgi:hypothetical protein
MNSKALDAAARFTAWSAIVGGVFAYLNVALVLTAVGGNTDLLFDGAAMLAAPTQTHALFRWGMFADILGFYLPVLVIGAYLWRRFRDRAGFMGDAALLAIVVYTVLGIAGAAMQLAALTPLAQLHGSSDESVQAAMEASWIAIVHACQKGLWWAEGPVVLFWGLVVGAQLKQSGWSGAQLVLLKIVGIGFGLFFVVGMFPSLAELMKLTLIVVVLIFPLWMILFGRSLLSRPE